MGIFHAIQVMSMHWIGEIRMNHIFGRSLIIIGALFGTQILSAYEYRIKDLGLVGRATYPGAVNDLGIAVFTAFPEGSSEDITFPGGAYKYQGNASIILSGLGGPQDMVLDINNLGSAVGHSSAGDIHSTPTRAVIFENGQAYDLGVNPGSASFATALNDSEQVVGYASLPGEQHAFLYMGPGNVIDLGTPGVSSAAYDINEAGQVVGSSWGFDSEENFSESAFLYADGQMTNLGTLGGKSSSAAAINNVGQVVGSSLTMSGEYHAFIYDSTNHMLDIGPPGLNSVAMDINDDGVVVGTIYSLATGTQAILFDGMGDTTLLQDLIPLDSGWSRLSTPTSINNRGQILGQGILNGEVRVFLMTPIMIPEPSAQTVVLVGLTFSPLRWRKGRTIDTTPPIIGFKIRNNTGTLARCS